MLDERRREKGRDEGEETGEEKKGERQGRERKGKIEKNTGKVPTLCFGI